MTAADTTGPGRSGRRGRTVGAVVSRLVLGVLSLAAAGWALLAYAMIPAGRHDREALDGAGLGALFAIGCAGPALVLTAVPVALGWLRRRWFLPPLALLVLAAARYAYLVIAYDPW